MSRTKSTAQEEPSAEGKQPDAQEENESGASTKKKTRRRSRPAGTAGRQKRGTPQAEQEESDRVPSPPVLSYQGGATLIFEVAGQRYGLPVENVIQIVEMMAITPLPAAPEIVAGVINFHGHVIPVVEVRRRLGRPAQAYVLQTPIIIAKINGHTVGLIVDTVSDVVEIPAGQVEVPEQIFTEETSPPVQTLGGVARLSDGLLLILDVGVFLSPGGKQALDKVISGQQEILEE